MFCSWLCFGIVRFIHVSNARPEVREKRKISRETAYILAGPSTGPLLRAIAHYELKLLKGFPA